MTQRLVILSPSPRSLPFRTPLFSPLHTPLPGAIFRLPRARMEGFATFCRTPRVHAKKIRARKTAFCARKPAVRARTIRPSAPFFTVSKRDKPCPRPSVLPPKPLKIRPENKNHKPFSATFPPASPLHPRRRKQKTSSRPTFAPPPTRQATPRQ